MSSEIPLESIWHAVGHRLAATAGAAAALTALLWKAPVDVACLRGGLTWAATLVAARLARWLLVRVDTVTVPEPGPESQDEDSTLQASDAPAR